MSDSGNLAPFAAAAEPLGHSRLMLLLFFQTAVS
jgi:hypothetical protein